MRRMSISLASREVVENWDKEYRKGMDKRYPSLELVRLEKWYFGGKSGRALDYGFGTGANLIHLLECGHIVDGLEVSREAIQLVERKLAQRADIRDRATLTYLDADADRLPYGDATFDYVVCLSVLSLLSSRDRVERLLGEFARVMKSGAKIVVDINGRTSEFASKGRPIGNDVYEFQTSPDHPPVRTYCLSDEKAFVELLRPCFVVDDIGFAAHKYMHSEIFEYIVCARTPERNA